MLHNYGVYENLWAVGSVLGNRRFPRSNTRNYPFAMLDSIRITSVVYSEIIRWNVHFDASNCYVSAKSALTGCWIRALPDIIFVPTQNPQLPILAACLEITPVHSPRSFPKTSRGNGSLSLLPVFRDSRTLGLPGYYLD